MKTSLRTGVATAIALGSVAVAAVPSYATSYPSSCSGNTYAGVCYTATTVAKSTKVVDSVTVSNKTKKKIVNAHCSFTKTLSYTMSATATVGASASAKVSAGILGAVEVAVSASVSAELSQTASQAADAGGSFDLAPGESVVCERTYTKVTATVKQYTYSGSTSTTTYYSTTVPSSFGVTFVDG